MIGGATFLHSLLNENNKHQTFLLSVVIDILSFHFNKEAPTKTCGSPFSWMIKRIRCMSEDNIAFLSEYNNMLYKNAFIFVEIFIFSLSSTLALISFFNCSGLRE